MYRVGEYRRAAKVAYPNAYATNAEAKEDKAKYLFNCAQRAHVSFTEHWPSMLIGLLAGGLKCKFLDRRGAIPRWDACVLRVWSIDQ